MERCRYIFKKIQFLLKWIKKIPKSMQSGTLHIAYSLISISHRCSSIRKYVDQVWLPHRRTLENLEPLYQPKTGGRIFSSNRPIFFGLTDVKPNEWPLTKLIFRRFFVGRSSAGRFSASYTENKQSVRWKNPAAGFWSVLARFSVG